MKKKECIKDMPQVMVKVALFLKVVACRLWNPQISTFLLAERDTVSKLLMVWEKLHCHIATLIQFFKMIFSFEAYMALYYRVDFKC